MAGLKTLIFAFVLTSLIGVLLITTLVEEGTVYEKNLTQVSSGSFDLQSFNDSIKDIQNQGQDSLNAFQQQNQNIFQQIFIIPAGIGNIFVNTLSMVIAPFTLIANIITNTFGIPIIVTNTILGLLTIAFIFSLWILFKSGQSN